MNGFALGVALGWLAAGAQLELDCARPERARDLIGRMMVSEIEAVEDINRAALWEAFGRCSPGARGEPCREESRKRHEALWMRQKADIQAKYQTMLNEFEERCRASLT